MFTDILVNVWPMLALFRGVDLGWFCYGLGGISHDVKSQLIVISGNLTAVRYRDDVHTCHKLWTKICEIRQKFKGDLTKFCEIFLNITLELPQYSLKSFFHVRSL